MADILCVDFKAKSRSYTRNPPPLEQIAVEAVESVTVPMCHDDLQGEGGCVLDAMYESSLGFVDGDKPA